MKDFNALTEQNEKDAVTKFKEYGQGIHIGKYIAGGETSAWADLIDSDKFSENALKNKMLELATKISTTCNDEFLGDLSTAFTIRDNKNKLVKFSYEECYLFVRGALRYRRETADYKKKREELTKLKEFVEANKPQETKVAEATARLKELEAQLD